MDADRYPGALDEAPLAVVWALSAPGASGGTFGAVPRHGLAQALLEGHLRLPPEAVMGAGGVEAAAGLPVRL